MSHLRIQKPAIPIAANIKGFLAESRADKLAKVIADEHHASHGYRIRAYACRREGDDGWTVLARPAHRDLNEDELDTMRREAERFLNACGDTEGVTL